MIHLYPKKSLDKKQLERLLAGWNQEDLVVWEQRSGSLRLRGFSSWLQGQRRRRNSLNQLKS